MINTKEANIKTKRGAIWLGSVDINPEPLILSVAFTPLPSPKIK